jgi:hypothetical protein
VTLGVHPGWAYYEALVPGGNILYRTDRANGSAEEWTGSAWIVTPSDAANHLFRLINTGDLGIEPVDPHDALDRTHPRNLNKYSPDQPRDDHGRFGEGDTPSGDVASAVAAGVASGGFTVHPTRATSPATGYQVAVRGRGSIVSDTVLHDHAALIGALRDVVAKNGDLLKAGGKFYIGGWADGGKLYLDVSERMSSRAAAVAAGQDRNQISIWDNARKQEIPTGGTGT